MPDLPAVEAASLLGISIETLRRRVRRGDLPSRLTSDGRLIVTVPEAPQSASPQDSAISTRQQETQNPIIANSQRDSQEREILTSTVTDRLADSRQQEAQNSIVIIPPAVAAELTQLREELAALRERTALQQEWSAEQRQREEDLRDQLAGITASVADRDRRILELLGEMGTFRERAATVEALERNINSFDQQLAQAAERMAAAETANSELRQLLLQAQLQLQALMPKLPPPEPQEGYSNKPWWRWW